MNIRRYIIKPIRLTEVGFKVVQVRLSLLETQSEFAEHFLVSKETIHRWEVGKVLKLNRMNTIILDSLYTKVDREGKLVSPQQARLMFREQIEDKGDATR